ncbi:unnamed protein product [Adineta steineri]|uniref:Agrin n=1 Tax=Adineta steineri TaxID=433720 RepID=A0A815CP08_9BILA|nr:unnamed protein product [Adineta steineri]
MNKSPGVSADQSHHNNKNRKFLYIILIFVGIIILLASLFLIAIIYSKVKPRTQKKSGTVFDSNFTDSYSNRSEQTCLYGYSECRYNATCTEQNECRCIFSCSGNGQSIEHTNKCRLAQDICKSYYEKKDLTCSSKICSHGAKCVINDNGLPRCDCPNNCNEYIQTISSDGLVCGNDHETYETICDLNKRACQIQQNLYPAYLGRCQNCQNSSCISNNQKCDPYIDCSSEYLPLCASNLHNYSNECEMHKYACQSNINLTKLHDRICYPDEEQQLRRACETINCFNGKTCMLENGMGVCRCLFNCSSEKNQICASNGLLYQNLCEMKRDGCTRDENLTPINTSYCLSICDKIYCPYGQCKHQSTDQIECVCKQCSTKYSEHEKICGDNGFTYPTQCLLEYDACKKQIDIKPKHMGRCNNCQNIICPYHGYCQSEQGNYTCKCLTKANCSTIRNNNSQPICGSNRELFYSQCEMDIRSCELNTHIYTISPQDCILDKDQPEYTSECGYDELLIDLKTNHYIECGTSKQCPINSYCNKQTNRCCIKIINAILPYRKCLSDEYCGRNMICSYGLCQCARNDMIPARKKRECIVLPSYISDNSTCSMTPYGCCRDKVTISPTFDRHGCPEYCNCHPTGSLRSSCDPKTGSCYCRPAVDGSHCSYCESEYWAFSRILTHNNTGCTPCGCHPYGSVRKDCSQDTGQCLCHSYTTGRQCDKCIDLSLTLTDGGCVNLNKNRRRRQRTCQDLICRFDGICQLSNDHPYCACDHMICTDDEQYPLDICASDGRTYKSKCDIKRQQCLKQYEIIFMYAGVCHGDEDLQLEENIIFEEELSTIPIDSKRCISNIDCGENMVCLSEFCECAKQKYQRIPGPRCIMPKLMSIDSNKTINSIRRTSNDVCIQGNQCKNHGICQDQSNGSYVCLCTYGWAGTHCNEKIEINFPHFNRQSYFEINSLTLIKYIELIFATEHTSGLLLYSNDKLKEFHFIVSIRNQIIDITIRSLRFISTIQLSNKINLNTYVRLQIYILYNEIQVKIDNGTILSRLLSFDILLKDRLYLGGLPASLQSVYQQYNVDDGFQGCIHEFSINGKQIMFNNSQLITQNINECTMNPCRSIKCQHENRCLPVTNNDMNNYKCLDNNYLLIDRCLMKPCMINQQCIHVYPNDYQCICLNCSSDNQYIAEFHSNSYIKYVPFEPLENTGKFKIELWFLTENSSGLLFYSEHINSKKGHMKLYIQRRMLIFNMIIGSKSILLSSRYPIELKTWHQCIIEIYGQKITFIVNQESPVISYELFSSNILWPRSFTFIGNLPNQYRSTNSHIIEGFQGAIQKVILNNHSINDIRHNAIELFNLSEYYGYPCQSNPCPSNQQCYQRESNNYTCIEQSKHQDASLELDGTVNVIYSYTPLNLNRNYFDLLLKTKHSSGLIFYIGETSISFFSKYLSLILVNGFLQFETKIDINSSVVVVKSRIRIDDGRWHRVEIERFRRRIIMKLDDSHRYQTVLLSKETEFYPNPSYIYIGGYNRLCNYDEQHCRSYRGCLNNITIDHNYLSLIKGDINQHRLLKPCSSNLTK